VIIHAAQAAVQHIRLGSFSQIVLGLGFGVEGLVTYTCKHVHMQFMCGYLAHAAVLIVSGCMIKKHTAECRYGGTGNFLIFFRRYLAGKPRIHPMGLTISTW